MLSNRPRLSPILRIIQVSPKALATAWMAAPLMTLALLGAPAVAHPGHGEEFLDLGIAAPKADGLSQAKAALGLRDATIQRPDIARAGEIVTLAVVLDGLPYTVSLQPHSIRSESFTVLIDDGTGGLPRPLGRELPITTYRGDLVGHPDAVAVASITDHRVALSVCLDTQRPHETTFRMQPLADAVPGADAALYVVYRDTDVLASDEHDCGTDHTFQAEPETANTQVTIDRGPACTKLAEVVFDTDFEYFSTFLGRTDPIAACVADVETVMNEVDFVFQRDITVATKVNTIVLRTTINDPYSDATAASAVLDENRAIWAAISQATQPRDFEHLMTGKNLDGSTIGLAYVGVICNNSVPVGLSQTLFSATLTRRALLTAHEMGHQWNAPHDNQAGSACETTLDGFIMNPSLGNQPLQFSPCSITRMLTYRDNSTSCVPTPTVAPQVRPDFASSQASQSVDIDILRNDTSNCGPLSFTLPTATTPHGTLTILVGTGPRGRNQVRYTPAPGYSGPDSFSYTATNSSGNATGTVNIDVVAPRVPENPANTIAGLTVDFYDLAAGLTALPNFSTLTPFTRATIGNINVPSTTGNISVSGRAENLGAVYAGFFNAPTTGVYTFFTESDDGSKLFFGNSLVVNNDGSHGMQELSGTIGLAAGTHAFRVEYYEGTGSAGLIVRYQGPSISKQVIPTGRLSHTGPCAGDFNNDGPVTADDIFAFLDAWFAQQGQSGAGLSADFNNSNTVTADDIFAFLNAWFAPCP